MYGFLRFDTASQERFAVVVNLHATQAMKEVKIIFGEDAVVFLGLGAVDGKTPLVFTDRLTDGAANIATSCINEATGSGVWLGDVPPLTAYYFEIVAHPK
jgi:hypothetical protein